MIVLFTYPSLFGLPDNNPYGLKVIAFLRLGGVPFEQRPIFDASAAPRGQLPYIEDDGVTVGDSDAILAHVTARYRVTVDEGLSPAQRRLDLLIRRTLDDLYWVMSYARWHDPANWPQFRDGLLAEHPQLTKEALDAARAYNFQRYHYQGIGRFEPEQAYARGLADLGVLASLLEASPYLLDARPRSTDAGAYGFLANILFHPIDNPLKRCFAQHPVLAGYTQRLHGAVQAGPAGADVAAG